MKLPYHGTYVREIEGVTQIMSIGDDNKDLIVALLRKAYPEITEDSLDELYINKAFTIFGTAYFRLQMCWMVLYRHDYKWYVYYVPQSNLNLSQLASLPKVPSFMGF